MLALVVALLALTAEASEPSQALGIPGCGEFRVTGQLTCERDGSCVIVTYPGALSQSQVKIARAPLTYSGYRGTKDAPGWVTARVRIKRQLAASSWEGQVLDQVPLRARPSFSAHAVEAVAPGACDGK
jgi:hypothetical protein